MRRQCERAGGTMETLTPAQAEKVITAVERVLEAYLARPTDLKQIVHEMRLEIGAERFARGEVAPARAIADLPLAPTRVAHTGGASARSAAPSARRRR